MLQNMIEKIFPVHFFSSHDNGSSFVLIIDRLHERKIYMQFREISICIKKNLHFRQSIMSEKNLRYNSIYNFMLYSHIRTFTYMCYFFEFFKYHTACEIISKILSLILFRIIDCLMSEAWNISTHNKIVLINCSLVLHLNLFLIYLSEINRFLKIVAQKCSEMICTI